MVELFELIAAKPLEFLAGVGISTTTIYTVFRALKGFISLITKKSQKAKELLQNNNIADTIITKLGGIDAFINKIGDVVINKLTNSQTIKEFKSALEKVANSSNCPVELKAYINTVLSQSGSEQLALLYEQNIKAVLDAGKQVINETIQQGAEKLESTQNKPKNETPEPIETPTEITAIVTRKRKKKVDIDKGDVSYV